MDRGIGGIGSIRDIGDPYDPRRGLPIIEQRNIPGLVAGKSAMLYTPSYLDDVAGYMARVAQAAGRGSLSNADPAAGVYVPSSGQLSLGIRPGRSTPESVLIPQSEPLLEQAVAAAEQERRARPDRVARPARGDDAGRPLGILLGGAPAQLESGAGLVDALRGNPAASVPGDQIVIARPRTELPADSRLLDRDRFTGTTDWSDPSRPGPAREADRVAARGRAAADAVIGNWSGVVRDANLGDYERIANELLGEEPISVRSVDESVSDNERIGAFTSEDPTESEGRKQPSGDINPYYSVEVPARVARADGRGLSWTVDTGRGFRPASAVIDPSQIKETRTQNPMRKQGTRGGFANESDNTASFQREKQINIGDLVKEAMEQAKTPVITKSALEAARAAGRARAAAPEERDRNLVGYIIPPGQTEELPVYAVTEGRGGPRKTTAVQRPSADDPLRGVDSVDEEYFRIGSPTNRDATALRNELRRILGVDAASETGPAPLLANTWDRRFAEEKLGSPSLEQFAKELEGGAFMQDPQEGASVYKKLARALETGYLEVPDRTRGARPGAMTVVPIDRGTILGLYSGLSGQDTPEIAAAKQFRAFLQEAPRPLTPQEGVDAATQFAARWGVDTNAVLRAAAERQDVEIPLPGAAGGVKRVSVPANDPGRPLFAPGSAAEELLGQALREIRGGREVDLFKEPPSEGEIGDPLRTGDLEEAVMAAAGAEDLNEKAAMVFGFDPEDDFSGMAAGGAPRQARYGDFGDANSGISVQKLGAQADDPLTRAAIALTGDVSQGVYLADAARRNAAPGRVAPVNQYGSAVGIIEDLPARDPRAVLMELAGRRSPVEITPGPQQLRAKYQGDFASTSGQGKPVLGQRGYQMMAQALGGDPGSAAHERAMQLLASRLAGRRGGAA